MARIDWSTIGDRIFEAGIDRGVLYVDDSPGVAWVGLTQVSHGTSGGNTKPRYLDGVMISNHASPERFSATIEAFSYPRLFERCEGTVGVQNGLRVSQQRRRPFGMTYRTLVGNSDRSTDYAYKIHILYNLRAVTSDRDYQTLADETEPISFNWKVTSRGELVPNLMPVSHFEVDTRDIPAELLSTLEGILYGDDFTDPSLPSPGELIFLFDAFEDDVYDAGSPGSEVFAIYDSGIHSDPVTSILDGGPL